MTDPFRGRFGMNRGTRCRLAAVALLLPAILGMLPGAAEAATEAYFSPDGGIRQRLVDAIREARASIDVAVFHLTSFTLADALAEAQGRGVRVRVLTDGEKLREGGGAHRILARHRVPLRGLGAADQGLMHHKFALFDAARLATGSYNWTQSAEVANHENLLLTDDPALVAAFQREFARLWEAARP